MSCLLIVTTCDFLAIIPCSGCRFWLFADISSKKLIPTLKTSCTLLRMDWNLAIEKNTHALAQIVSGLWKLVGVEPKSVEDYEPSISSTVLATSSSSKRATLPSSVLATSSSSEPTTSSSSDLIRGSKSEPVGVMHSPLGSSPPPIPTSRAARAHVPPHKEEANIPLGPITRRILVRTLRTIEAALRRLIVLYVYVYGIKAVARKRQDKRNRPLPDFSKFGSSSSDRPPVFRLFDPRKPLTLMLSLSKHEGEMYGASTLRQAQGEGFGLSSSDLSTSSSSGLSRGSTGRAEEIIQRLAQLSGNTFNNNTNEAWVDPRDKPEDDEFDRPEDDGVGFLPSVAGQGIATSNSASPRTDGDTQVSAEKLIRRLKALDHALQTIPQQAKRLARIMAQREHAPPGPRKVPPMRPGAPPGSNKSSNEPSHEVLREIHGLVCDWEKDVWERRSGNFEVP